MSEEEKRVIDTFKQGYGLTNAEQKILLNLIQKQSKVIDEIVDKLYKLKIKLELNVLLEDCFIPRNFSDIDNCVKTDCKECIKQYFYRKVGNEDENND